MLCIVLLMIVERLRILRLIVWPTLKNVLGVKMTVTVSKITFFCLPATMNLSGGRHPNDNQGVILQPLKGGGRNHSLIFGV